MLIDEKRPCLVYLIRHAEPDNWGDELLRYDIPPGPPLSAAGRVKAERAAEFLSQRPPKVLYTSPLRRAAETAGILSRKLNISPVQDESIAEHRREESNDDVAARVGYFWERHIAYPAANPIGLVSHGSPIRLLLRILGGPQWEPPRRYSFDHGNTTPTCGIWRATCATLGDPCAGWNLELVFGLD